MTTEDLYPDGDELYELLKNELSYLKDKDGPIARNRTYITTLYENLKDMEPTDWELDISPNWLLRFGGDAEGDQDRRDFGSAEGIAVIGGYGSATDGDIDHYSINLTLLAQSETDTRGSDAPCCWQRDQMDSDWRVARRYHFDIETITENEQDPKPVSHFQSGGNFDGQALPHHDPHYCSSPLDKPRLPHPPMDPLLILHMLATQYDSLERLIESSWVGFVKESENKLWRPYHKAIVGQYQTESTRPTMAEFFENV